jgi:hypothetical protein
MTWDTMFGLVMQEVILGQEIIHSLTLIKEMNSGISREYFKKIIFYSRNNVVFTP